MSVTSRGSTKFHLKRGPSSNDFSESIGERDKSEPTLVLTLVFTAPSDHFRHQRQLARIHVNPSNDYIQIKHLDLLDPQRKIKGLRKTKTKKSLS